MKKHGTARLTRSFSVLAAFAMATLLVTSGNAAYADDAAPTDPPASTDTAAPVPEDPAPAADDAAPTTEDAAPDATDDAATEDTATEDTAADDSATADDTPATDAQDAAAAAESGNGPMATTLKKLAVTPLAAAVDVDVPCGDSDANELVGGFEIDGDLCVNHGGQDWDGVDFSSDSADTVVDGFDDATTFNMGDAENLDPSTWHVNGPTPNGKSDIGTAYAYSTMVGDDVFGYFAFTNTSTSGGTQQYDVEYNQNEAAENANGATVPTREPGDLLFRFSSVGSDPMTFTDAKIYRLAGDFGSDDCFAIDDSDPAGGWCTLDIPPGSFHADASDDGLFQEASIEISAFFDEGTCSGVFGTTQIRSVTGNSFATSALKDYVFPLDVTTPSTCGSLTIEKRDVDTNALVGGGFYEIVGDPRPGADPNDTLCVYDGDGTSLGDDILSVHPELLDECDTILADGTADGIFDVGEVEPGTYTVTEVLPPPGYLLNPGDGNTQEVTLGDGDAETVTFANHKAWQPLDIAKTAKGAFGAQYLWGITKEIAPTADGPWSDGTDPDNPLVKMADLGGDTSLYYRVVVTEEGVNTSAYVVTGTIHVDNPNDAAVEATISESLSGCTLAGTDDAFPIDVSVPAGGGDYDFTCDLGDGPQDPGSNTATVTWDKSTYPQSTGDIDADGEFSDDVSVAYDFDEASSIDKTITVTDDHVTFDPAWVITAGDEADGTYESDVYSFDTAVGTQGTCSPVITNTATITGDTDVLGETSESGQVCVPAVIPPEPPEVLPPSLPNTGGPSPMLLAEGVWLLLLGGGLVLGTMRKRRS